VNIGSLYVKTTQRSMVQRRRGARCRNVRLRFLSGDGADHQRVSPTIEARRSYCVIRRFLKRRWPPRPPSSASLRSVEASNSPTYVALPLHAVTNFGA
jgi:hypothetical protein